MSGPDYLFDKQGPPDPEIERLEKLLARHRYQAAARGTFAAGSAGPKRAVLLAAAGILVLAVAAWQLLARRDAPAVDPAQGYRVEGLADVDQAGCGRLGHAATLPTAVESHRELREEAPAWPAVIRVATVQAATARQSSTN
jgi:hypothetical protein